MRKHITLQLQKKGVVNNNNTVIYFFFRYTIFTWFRYDVVYNNFDALGVGEERNGQTLGQ